METRRAEPDCAGVATSTASHGPTARQVAVLATVIASGTYKEAAFALGISPLTVRNHLADIRYRLGVETNGQAIYVLTALGVLVVPSVGRRAA